MEIKVLEKETKTISREDYLKKITKSIGMPENTALPKYEIGHLVKVELSLTFYINEEKLVVPTFISGVSWGPLGWLYTVAYFTPYSLDVCQDHVTESQIKGRYE